MNKIYTKTGDKGFTSFRGCRIPKHSDWINFIGKLDELSVEIASLNYLVNSYLLIDISKLLLEIGCELHTNKLNSKTSDYIQDILYSLERSMDGMTKNLDSLNSFIIVSGCDSSIQSHKCRVKVREIERYCSKLIKKYPDNVRYIKLFNRLSDYFYIYALYLNKQNGIPEITYKLNNE